MLLRLTIRDFVLVDRLELEFSRGFGALTGETGAGKSILVDAISFALGERADAGLVRHGAERAEVSAEFDISGLPELGQLLQEFDLPAATEESFMLRRVLDAGGRSRAYANGSPVTVQQLRELTDSLIDIHGQHAHQSLLRPDAQRALLDAFAGVSDLAASVADAWRSRQRAQEQLAVALADTEASEQARAQLQDEVAELQAAAFSLDDWTAINAEQSRLAHAASLIDGARSALDALSEGESPVLGAVGHFASELESLQSFDADLAPFAELLRSAEANVGEAVSGLRRYAGKVDLDPERLSALDRRIEALLALARKYRVPVERLPESLAEREARLAELSRTADPIALQAALDNACKAYEALADRLTAERTKAAQALGQAVTYQMQDLALTGGVFAVALAPEPEPTAHGSERVELQLAAAPGAEPRPLAKVASGGELSRISLALQVVAAGASTVPTLIFDEVDVGIGGGVAEVVGRLLRSLGVERQVLCVTHLPQVAACAHTHWKVRKLPGPRSEVVVLDTDGRVEEIARMLGGVELTELTRRHAAEMLSAAQ